MSSVRFAAVKSAKIDRRGFSTGGVNMNVRSVAVVLTIALCSCAGFARDKIVLQAEDAQLKGPVPTTQRSGYEGKGYITNFIANDAQATFNFKSPGGFYELMIRYSSPNANKGFDFTVNGTRSSEMFLPTKQEFVAHDAGLVDLKDGDNTVTIHRGWGYFDIDSITLRPVDGPKPPKAVSARLSDPKATDEARKEMRLFADNYGKTTYSGTASMEDALYVKEKTGVLPTIIAGDFIEVSPSRVARGAKDDDTAGHLVNYSKAGHLVTIQWHWNAPKDLIDKEEMTDANGNKVNAAWYKGFYTNATTFNLDKALDDENSEEHKLILRDIDVIATELKKLSDAHVPVLWRPLHEAEGKWFWWGAHGPQQFVKLWKLMYARLTKEHNLHNLIWVYTSGGDREWYPGDDFVDIVCVDQYPTDLHDPLTGIWTMLQKQFEGKKLLTIAEFGGVPDVPAMQHFGAWWSYFVSWGGDLGPKKMSDAELKRIYLYGGVTNHAPAK
jgi:mannan endo-1,4-beta-mannosidase